MKLTLAAGVALAIGGFFGARFVASSKAAHAPASAATTASPVTAAAASAAPLELHVPHVKGSITLDGDLDDTGWTGPIARTGAFLGADGTPARPYSDARITWGDGHLYLALYAADEDVRDAKRAPDGPTWLDDSFHIVFVRGDETSVIDISATGVVTDARKSRGGSLDFSWQSGLHVSTELDGTINDSHDDDEEWSLEIALPLESLGLKGKRGESIGLALRRCDTPKGATRTCGSWGEAPSPGVLAPQAPSPGVLAPQAPSPGAVIVLD
jgi:hypothetical protein